MEIVKLSGIQMDTGSPTPMLFMEGFRNLNVIFYGYDPQANDLTEEMDGVYTIRFKSVVQYKFGTPSDEVLSGHPYYKLGLGFYAFHEVVNSDWIKELMKINSVHSNFNKERWKSKRHFIITFHDETFECVSTEYEIKFEKKSLKEKAVELSGKIIEEIFGDEGL